MKFLQVLGFAGSFARFEFEPHDAGDAVCGDQIWSNGHEIEIADYVDEECLNELINMVSNKTAFKGALRRMEII